MFNLRLYVIKKVLRKFKEKADFHNIPYVRGGLERLAARGANYLDGISYEPVQIDRMAAEWLIPTPDSDQVLLYLHGGGYAAGSINTHRGMVSNLVHYAGIRTLIIDYRLAPENKFPAPVEDVVLAYHWLLDQGYAPESIAIGGDSAGGGLTVGSLLYFRDHGIRLPGCAICLSPWLDLTGSGATMETKKDEEPMLNPLGMPVWAKNYMGETDLRNAYASPIFAENLENLPPLYIQVGECEILLDDSLRFEKLSRAAGNDVKLEVYPDMLHVFQAFWKYLSTARKANQKLAEYLKTHLK